MNTADRAIVAAAEERDRTPGTDAGRRLVEIMYAPPYQGMFRPALIREIHAIEAEARADAGHRTVGPHDCFVMNCNGLGPEVERLRHLLRERDTQAEDAADDAAAAEATVGKWDA